MCRVKECFGACPVFKCPGGCKSVVAFSVWRQYVPDDVADLYEKNAQ